MSSYYSLEARNRDLTLKDVTKSASCGRSGSFYFLQESKYRDVEYNAVADKGLHLYGVEVCAKGEETGLEFFLEGSRVQLDGRELQ